MILGAIFDENTTKWRSACLYAEADIQLNLLSHIHNFVLTGKITFSLHMRNIKFYTRKSSDGEAKEAWSLWLGSPY